MSKSQIVIQLAAESRASTPTVRKWIADPSSVHAAYAYALETAAKKLKLEDAVAELRAPVEATGTEG